MHGIKILLILCLMTFAQGTNSSLPPNWRSSWIVGGTAAALGEFPYMALVILANGFCGGSIISHSYILTAAHCVAETRLPSVSVRVGIIKGDNPSIKVSHIVIHPTYEPHTKSNDIALLKLQKPVVYGHWVQPIPLPNQGEKTVAGTKCVITGWGCTGERPAETYRPVLGYLQKLQVKIIDNHEGRKHCEPIFDTDVCTVADRGKSACVGDSGGPLVCGGILIGIISGKAEGSCENFRYTIHAGVSHHIKWIKQNAGHRSSV